jgi:serine/threonine protein kinase
MQKTRSQYHLTRVLAKKYSHSTYLASPTNEPERQVALTTYASSLFSSPYERESLLQKVQRIKDLRHPHLLPILDMGIEEGQPFVVWEYLPNGSLRNHLKVVSPDRLELRDALTILSQVGEALVYAHEQNIIHGNIKPENILLDANGLAVLTGFSFVSRQDAIIRNQALEEYAFCYMAPEQFAGTYTVRSDQFALGCLAYELIAGQTPFAARSLSSMMAEPRTTQPVQLSEKIANLPPALETAVFKALAYDPDQRFFDFSPFLEVIQSVLSPPPANPLILEKRDDVLFTDHFGETEANVLFTDPFGEEEANVLFTDPFGEEEADILPVSVATNSAYHEQTEYPRVQMTTLLTSSADRHGPLTILTQRKRQLVLLLSVIVVVITAALWHSGMIPFGTNSSLTSSVSNTLKANLNTTPPAILVHPLTRNQLTATPANSNATTTANSNPNAAVAGSNQYPTPKLNFPTSGPGSYPPNSGPGSYPPNSGPGSYPPTSGSGPYPPTSGSGPYPPNSGFGFPSR